MTYQKPIRIFLILLAMILATHSFRLQPNQNIKENKEVIDSDDSSIMGGSISNYEMWTNETFAKSTQMNQVFDYITSNPVNLNNITKKVNDTISYVIYNSRTTLFYQNENQTAEFFLPDKIVAIADGFVEVKVTFSWMRIGQGAVNGTGTAQGSSEEIAIGFRFNDKAANFTKYEIVDYLPFSCDNLKLTYISGNNDSQQDKKQIISMVSAQPNKNTLSYELQTQVSQMYTKYIDWFFNDKSPVTNQKFSYKWSNPAAASIVQVYNFTREPFFFIFRNNTAINCGYTINIDDNPNPRPYETKLPAKTYDPKQYGGSQSYISLKFLENVLVTAARKYQLDTTLERTYWASRYFNFMAQEVYVPFPSLQKITDPETEIAGNCKVDENSIAVIKWYGDKLNVDVTYRCDMSVLLRERTKFTQFQIDLNLVVDPRAYKTQIDFWLYTYHHEVTFVPMPEFPMVDKMAADKVIINALQKLFEGKLFGSGWPIYPNRVSPGIVVDEDQILIYDKVQK